MASEQFVMETQMFGTLFEEICLRDKVAANPAARNPEPSFLAVLVGVTPFEPSFLAVLVGVTPFARRLPSGVCVVPITSLGA